MSFSILLQKGDKTWTCEVVDDTIITVWGKNDGKMQRNECKVLSGKNIGKSNETNAFQQAEIEARSKVNKKIMEGYEVHTVINYPFSLKVKPEVPAPMLAKNFSDEMHKLSGHVYFQPKLDGIRCIANVKTGDLFSRKMESIVIPHISNAVLGIAPKLDPKIEWIDGELFNPELGFQEIASIVRSQKNVHPDIHKIEYHVYDIINEADCSGRMNELNKLSWSCDKDFPIKVVPTYYDDYSKFAELHKLFVDSGYEGGMVRVPSSLYKVGKRSDGLLKLKDFKQEEYAILSLNKEKYEDTLGTFGLITKDGKTFEARPSFSDAERKELWLNREMIDWDWCNYVATVKFFEYTNDGIPRFPICLGIRHKDDR